MPTILVVDDEPAIRALVRAALSEHGYRVLEAADGAQALRLALSERPDLVLLDVALPGMSGLEVSRRLREDSGTASTPILLLTGLAPETWPVEGRFDAQGLVQKPFSPQGLVRQVAEALASFAPSHAR